MTKKVIKPVIKPIFIIKLHQSASKEEVDEIALNVGKSFKDEYYVLVTTSINIKKGDSLFECYNTSDLGDKSFEELKEIALKHID